MFVPMKAVTFHMGRAQMMMVPAKPIIERVIPKTCRAMDGAGDDKKQTETTFNSVFYQCFCNIHLTHTYICNMNDFLSLGGSRFQNTGEH